MFPDGTNFWLNNSKKGPPKITFVREKLGARTSGEFAKNYVAKEKLARNCRKARKQFGNNGWIGTIACLIGKGKKPVKSVFPGIFSMHRIVPGMSFSSDYNTGNIFLQSKKINPSIFFKYC
jgi:hypothetical protein